MELYISDLEGEGALRDPWLWMNEFREYYKKRLVARRRLCCAGHISKHRTFILPFKVISWMSFSSSQWVDQQLGNFDVIGEPQEGVP